MNKRNPLLFIAVLTALIFGYFFFSLYNVKELERRLRVQKENELQSKIAELMQKESELAELQSEKTSIEQKLNERITELEGQMAGAREENRAISLRLEELTAEKNALESDNLLKQKSLDELTRKIRDLERDKSDLLNTINRMKQEMASISVAREEDKAPGAPNLPPPASAVELGQIVVQKSSGIAARVEHVNPTYGFVIVTAGSKDGMRPDLLLNILRDNRIIAKAAVQKVRPTISAALLLPQHTYGEVQVGDLVSVS